jgi:PAS domain S-box-containing protein
MQADGLYEALFDEAAEAILLVSPEGRILLANRTCQSLFGYQPAELLGQAIEVLVPERFRAGHIAHRARYAKNPQRRPMGTGLQLWGLKRDGREFPVDITLSAHGQDGETLCVVRDVSERVAHENFERALLAATTCAIVMADEEGVVRAWNRGAERMWGYPASFVQGRINLSELFVSALNEGEHDATARNRDGFLAPVRVSVARLQNPGGLSCIAVDMREHEEARRTLRAAYDARNRFFARASHELRTPLNAILGFGQLLAEDSAGKLGVAGERYLERMRSGGERLLRLTNDLLELSRWEMGAQSLHWEVFPVAPFLEEILADFRPEAAAHEIEFRWHAPPELEVCADRLRLGQILVNLVANALKYAPRGGKVSVEAGLEAEEVSFAVRDNGPGIAPEAQANIFEEFFQIQGAGRAKNVGTGLGLPIARRLVEAHEGRLTLESELGQGACFRVYLRRSTNS